MPLPGVHTTEVVSGQDATAAQYNNLRQESLRIVKYNAADMTVFNQTTLTGVPALEIPVENGKRYWVKFVLIYRSGSTPNIRVAIKADQAGITFAGVGYANISSTVTRLSMDETFVMAGTGVDEAGIIEGVVIADATGVVYPAFAQDIAHASSTSIKQYSISCAAQMN